LLWSGRERPLTRRGRLVGPYGPAIRDHRRNASRCADAQAAADCPALSVVFGPNAWSAGLQTVQVIEKFVRSKSRRSGRSSPAASAAAGLCGNHPKLRTSQAAEVDIADFPVGCQVNPRAALNQNGYVELRRAAAANVNRKVASMAACADHPSPAPPSPASAARRVLTTTARVTPIIDLR